MRMARAPSPTAAATRLTDPLRTSPAAKTPALLVSSSGRSPGSWLPVRTNPRSSRLDLVAQPADVREAADEDEQGFCRFDVALARLQVLDHDFLQRPFTVGLAQFTVHQHVDPLALLDPVGQVAGHVLAEFVAPDNEQHLGRVLGEEDRGLSGGVAATDDHHRVFPAQVRLQLGRRVVHARRSDGVQSGQVESSVADAGGDQHRPAADACFVRPAVLRGARPAPPVRRRWRAR